jgi:hypothetical protein
VTDGNNIIIAQLAELVANLDRDGTATTAGLRELVESCPSPRGGLPVRGDNCGREEAGRSPVSSPRIATQWSSTRSRTGAGKDRACLTAAWRHHMMHVDDLNLDQRWPCYLRHALEETPIRSIASYELYDDGHSMAALNFYAEHPHAFTTNR